MQRQIRDYEVPGALGVLIGLNATMAVPDLLVPISSLRLRQHFFAEVNAQHLGRSVVHGVLAVPAIAAAQVQHGRAIQRRKQRLQLVPLSGSCQTAFAAALLGISGEEYITSCYLQRYNTPNLIVKQSPSEQATAIVQKGSLSSYLTSDSTGALGNSGVKKDRECDKMCGNYRKWPERHRKI